MIANDGKLVTPSLLRLESAKAVDARQVIEPRIARQVLDVLHGVTSEVRHRPERAGRRLRRGRQDRHRPQSGQRRLRR